MAGILYLCATPIGNLEDMTPRAQRMLAEADIIAAEDTRHTLQLLNRFNIKGRLVRYDEHSKERQGAYLLDELLSGKNIALVSDAGFPGIADPGEQLARLAIDAGVQVVPVPGANAALCALIASGLPASPFFFGGFLPKSKKNRRQQLEEWQYLPATIILYEAPHRIEQVLQEVLEVWGDRQMAAARELTKLHEEFFRGMVSQCLTWLHEISPAVNSAWSSPEAWNSRSLRRKQRIRWRRYRNCWLVASIKKRRWRRLLKQIRFPNGNYIIN
ncbi:MAG: 16S rRNA (cytidine(1402)-2'-O)-methyltransferase [Phascolarctobacterium faecium]